MKKQVKKQMKKQYMPAVIVCVLILVLALAGAGVHVIRKYLPTKDRMDLNEYYGQTAEGESVIRPGYGRSWNRERFCLMSRHTFLWIL